MNKFVLFASNWGFNRMWIDDGEAVEGEVPENERQKASADGSIAQ